MARINTNVSSLIAQHNLRSSNADLQLRLQRLSTGLRINRGADDPAGLIVSERMRSEIQGIGQAIDNAERASNVIATAEGALAEVANLLTSIKGLVVEAANTGALSKEEIEANQLQIDSAIESITRIANTTSFAGLKLLNGSLDYITSGVTASAISDVSINGVNFGTSESIPVSVEVVTSAAKGSLLLSTGAASIPSALTLEIAGNLGVEVLTFGSGTALSAVTAAINRVADSTGVTATALSGGTSLQFTSAGYGSNAFVSVQKVPGSAGGGFFATTDVDGNSTKRDTGDDVVALINGSLALGQGTKVSFNSNSLNLELQLTEGFAITPGSQTFSITGGGSTFQLGPVVESGQQVGFGIQSVHAARLGNSTVGFLNSITSGGDNSLINGKAAEASDIIEQSITQVSLLRGRLGAFERNTLETNVRSLQTSLENITSAESRIRDADFAEEISKLTRAQVLTNVGTSVLAQANNSASNVLSLLQ